VFGIYGRDGMHAVSTNGRYVRKCIHQSSIKIRKRKGRINFSIIIKKNDTKKYFIYISIKNSIFVAVIKNIKYYVNIRTASS
jgi:hypothetical protein